MAGCCEHGDEISGWMKGEEYVGPAEQPYSMAIFKLVSKIAVFFHFIRLHGNSF
jgi:hypothetical protein